MVRTSELDERTLTLLYSTSSGPAMVFKWSLAKVLSRRSVSKIPRLRDWYTRRARIVSVVSFGRGRGEGSVVVTVEFRCSGVFGRIQGSEEYDEVALKRRCEWL
jgi:hypothetical protein